MKAVMRRMSRAVERPHLLLVDELPSVPPKIFVPLEDL